MKSTDIQSGNNFLNLFLNPLARVAPVLWKGKTGKDGLAPVYLRLEADNQRQYISTGVRVRSNQWNDRQGRVRGKDQKTDKLNSLVSRKVSQAEDVIIDLQRDGLPVTPRAIKERLASSSADDRTDFFRLAASRVAELERLGKIYTARRYASIAKKLKEYHKGRSLPLSSITPNFLRAYETYLVGDLKNRPSTVASNFRAIKALLNRAVRDGLLSRDANPFAGITVREPRSSKAKLAPDEIAALAALDLDQGTLLWHVRNYFLFSYYSAGIRFGDLCRLTWGNIRSGRLSYTMSKTGRPKEIKIVAQAEAILDAYRSDGGKPNDFIFPPLRRKDISSPQKERAAISSANALVNKYLKKLAEMADIAVPIAFHMSRHSFADYARRSGTSLYTISKALGHKDLKVTENYLKGFDEAALDEEMERLFGSDLGGKQVVHQRSS